MESPTLDGIDVIDQATEPDDEKEPLRAFSNPCPHRLGVVVSPLQRTSARFFVEVRR